MELTSLAHFDAMKFVPLFCGCLLWASSAWAAPAVTEIRLADTPGYVLTPAQVNEFVFRADGSFYWVEGTSTKLIRHRYSIGKEEFQELATTLGTHRFFELKPIYDRAKPGDLVISDAGGVVVSVTRGGNKKEVVDYAGFGPSNLRELELIIRGLASEYVGLQRTPLSSPQLHPVLTPTATPIPVIRGTQKTPN